MAKYWVKIYVEEKSIKTVRNIVARDFPGQEVLVDKINPNPSRADRLSEVNSLVEDAKSIVEELKEEMENWLDTIPENLQGGDKYSQIEDCISNLEEISGQLEEIDTSSIDFPSMMG